MHERRTHGSGRRLGAHRDADLAQILSVPSLSGGKKPVPPPKMVSENALIRAGRRVNARSLRESARCVSHERETRFGFQERGRMLTCLFGGRWMCVWKSEPIGGSKAVLLGSQSKPRTLLRLRSGDGSRSVSGMELSWEKRFVLTGLVSDHVKPSMRVQSHTSGPRAINAVWWPKISPMEGAAAVL